MMRIDDEMLMAYLDGELRADDRAAVKRALDADATLRAELDTQKRVRAALSAHYGPVAAEPVPDRLLAMLGADEDRGDVASLAAARDKRRRPVWRNLGTIAASLAVGLFAGRTLSLQGSDPLGFDQGALVAEGSLSDALDTQLASIQAADAPTRIGVTFADREGRLCRSFDTQAFAGLACRDAGDWRMVMTAPSSYASTQYRQAGSSPILEAAQAMMAGAPLDAEAERGAMESGWGR